MKRSVPGTRRSKKIHEEALCEKSSPDTDPSGIRAPANEAVNNLTKSLTNVELNFEKKLELMKDPFKETQV